MREEKAVLEEQIQTLHTQVEAQLVVLRKLEEKEQLLQNNLSTVEKELRSVEKELRSVERELRSVEKELRSVKARELRSVEQIRFAAEELASVISYRGNSRGPNSYYDVKRHTCLCLSLRQRALEMHKRKAVESSQTAAAAV